MKLKSIFVALTLLSAVFVVVMPANANLLTNGDFDANVGLAPGGWAVFENIPGWTKYSGQGIEVQQNTVVNAQSGNQYVELDSHPIPGNSGMKSNAVYLSIGSYDLDFYYQPRTVNADDNGIDYGIMDSSASVISSGSVDGPPTGWRYVSQTFQITTAGNYNVFFSAFGDYGTSGGNTLGGFIDTVSLNGVPEPATLLFLGLGLLGVAGIRRFKR